MTDTPAPAPEIPEEMVEAAALTMLTLGLFSELDEGKVNAVASKVLTAAGVPALLARVKELEALLEPFSRAADELCSEGAHDEPNEEVTVERHVHPYSREDIPLQAFVAARGAVAPRYSEEEIQWHAECKRRAGEYMAKVMHSVKLPPPEDSA